MKSFFKYLVSAISLIVLFENCIAQDYPDSSIEKMKKKGWYRVSTFYDISGDISPDEARERALNQAMRTAIENHTGVDVKSDVTKFSSNSDKLDRFTQWTSTTSRGVIVEINIINEGVKNYGDNLFVYEIECELEVGKQEGKRDPNFIINADINKNIFIHAEKNFSLSIEVSKSCYLYVFNIRSDDSVEPIIPNEYQSNFISKGQKFIVPNKRYNIKPELLEGKESDTEIIKIIALKKESGGLEFLNRGDTFSRFKLMRALVDIPLGDIAEYDLTYSIVREK